MKRQQLLRPALVGALLASWPLSTVARVSPAPTGAPVVSPSPSASVSAVPDPGTTPAPTPLKSLTAAQQATRLTTLKTKGDAEITRRQGNLNTALNKIASLTSLSAGDKSALTTEVQNEISGLTTLKSKLDNETALDAARTDVQSIITDYRVYVLVLPVARLVEAIDQLTNVEAKLTTLQAKIQGAADKDQSAGKDVTSIQKNITDLQAQINTAQNATTGLTAKLLALKPADYNADHTVLMQYRTSVGSAETALKAARDDAKQAIDGLNALK
jgi:DNA repair exonuclease SbcCD ATPase subunit